MSETVQYNSVRKGTVVTGVIGHDIHIMGIRIIERALRNSGFRVVPLGTQVRPNEFIAAAIEADADAIFVSSLDGHAKLWIPGFREKCTEAGLSNILLYLGGMLTIGEAKWEETLATFQLLGFNRIYPQRVSISQVMRDLEFDLNKVQSK